VTVFSISGSSLWEMFVGVGASRCGICFEQAKRNSPCIIFIDEDRCGRAATGRRFGRQPRRREQTLNQILVGWTALTPTRT